MTGTQIKKIRKNLKLTQIEFAKKVGLKSYHWISAIENGRAKIPESVRIICELMLLGTKKWDWPYNGRGELSCPHGVGHGGIHGCDGCCGLEQFKEAWSKRLAEGYRLKK